MWLWCLLSLGERNGNLELPLAALEWEDVGLGPVQ